MQDWYQFPALVLTALLLPAFGHLYLRTRDTRNLLWFLAFLFVVLRMILIYPALVVDFVTDNSPWRVAIGQSLSIAASGFFLGSLSPLSFRIGKYRILYVVPFIAPLIVCASLSAIVPHNVPPHGVMFWVFPCLGLMALIAELRWDHASGGSLPRWTGTVFCLLFGGCAIWLYFHGGIYWPLILAESAMRIMTALLVLSVFRRFSPGAALAALGFFVWSLPVLLIDPYFHQPSINLAVQRCIIMAKVVAALGLILLALENELAINLAANQRERRIRRELEAYTNLALSRRRVEDFDRQADEICHTIAAHSRFSRAALLLLQSNGIYRLAGVAGFDTATAHALDALASRIPVAGFLLPGDAPTAVDGSQTVRLNLQPWLTPGDDLDRLRFTSALAVPLQGRSSVEGALLLAGLRNGHTGDSLRADDLVPLEMLAARLQSVRSQTRMLEKLIDSEKFAGLGQLAGAVTQQLNNPLTVILGYASLLEDAPRLELQDRKAVNSILGAARTMRSTLESLHRVSRAPGNQLSAVSVTELLVDMERLHRSELLQRSIEFRLNIAPDLPRVLCHEQQLRQAVLHCLQFAMEAAESGAAESDRTVRLEATTEANRVQVLIAHSGPAFQHPDRAFDPFIPPQAGAADTAGLGLSLCATILRDNHGHASAINLDPRGAAIVLELQAA